MSLDATESFRIRGCLPKPQEVVDDSLVTDIHIVLVSMETVSAFIRLNYIDSCCFTDEIDGSPTFTSFYITIVAIDSARLNHSHQGLSFIHSRRAYVAAAGGGTCALEKLLICLNPNSS